MKSYPLITIIIPCYNPGKYLKECINSLKCSHDKIEVILIDDASTDKSVEKIKCKNIKTIRNGKNRGVSYSRNRGIDEANGKYVMFLDADDMLVNGAIGEVLKWASLDYDIIYFSNNKIAHNKYALLKQILGTNKDKICIAGPVSKLYKTDFLKTNSIKFKENIINGEDMLFNAEALIKTDSYKTINKNIYLYRRNNSSATRTFDERIIENDKNFQSYIEQILPNQYKNDISMLAINGLFTVITRISNLPYAKALTYYEKIDTKFYEKSSKSMQSLSGYKILILWLFLRKHYKITHSLLLMKRNISNLIKKNKEFTGL